MRDELKARIAQINAGTAPAGYKKTKVGIVPEEWKIVKLSKIARITGRIGYRGYTQNDITTAEEGVLALSPSNIVNGALNLEKCTYITQQKYEESPEIQIQEDDIIFTKTGSTFGKSACLKGFHQQATINPQLVIIKANVEIIQVLLAFYIQSLSFIRTVNQIVVGGAVPTLSQEELGKIKIAIPGDKREQQKIAEILTAQDAVIALMQKQIELLKQQKKGFLQKMFPAKGNKVPEIRFKDFTGDWEERKLGDISDFITKGATPTTYGFDWVDDGIPFFRNDAIKNNQFVYGEYSFISEKAHEVLKRSEITRDDILIAITGEIGKVGIVPQDVKKANINQHIARIRIVKNAVPYFVYQSLSTDVQQKRYNVIKTGISMPQLSLEQIRDTVILSPSLDEQKKVAEFFNNLDNIITIHQRKLEIEQQKKKALMQLLLSGKVRVES